MSGLLDQLRAAAPDRIEEVFLSHAAAADASADAELIDGAAWIAAHAADQAEMIVWTWLSELRQGRPADAALPVARGLLFALPDSGQIREDFVALCRAANGGRDDIGQWLDAAGLTATRVSPQRALRALDLALAVAPGSLLVERHEQRVYEVVRLDATAGQAVVRRWGNASAAERAVDCLRFGDDFEAAGDDDFRVLLQVRPDRLAELIGADPLAVVLGAVRAHGGQLDADKLADLLSPRFVEPDKWSKWWSRARSAAKRSPHLRIEGRSPAVLVYDEQGVTVEQETADALAAAARDPDRRLAVVEGYLKGRARPDAAFLAELAQRAGAWLANVDAGFADAVVAARLAELSVPVAEADAAKAHSLLADAADPAALVRTLPTDRLWALAVPLLPSARPAGCPEPDWQAAYLQLLPSAPPSACDTMAAALLEAGQLDRLNAEIMAVAESPIESLDALCWLWLGPAAADRLAVPPAGELLGQLLSAAGQADAIAKRNPTLGRAVRAKVRSALSARSYAMFRQYVESLVAAGAGPLRRQIRRAEGLGVVIPEQMLAILDERHPPVIERKTVEPWKEEDVIYASSAALAAREKEADRIRDVEMPANAKAIGAAAAHGDLSENSEYKFALEERDLLRARLARIQNELAVTRVTEPADAPTDHVSIYSVVELAAADDPAAAPVAVQIVSPWEGDVAALRFNYKAPLCQAMLGRHVGDAVRIPLGEAPERDYRIAAIRQAT